MPPQDCHVSATRIPDFADDEEFPGPDDEDLLEQGEETPDDAEPLEDEGFDISEFDEDDEAPLYEDDDELFIAGDEDLPDEPDDEEDDQDNEEETENDWYGSEMD